MSEVIAEGKRWGSEIEAQNDFMTVNIEVALVSPLFINSPELPNDVEFKIMVGVCRVQAATLRSLKLPCNLQMKILAKLGNCLFHIVHINYHSFVSFPRCAAEAFEIFFSK